MIVIVLEGRIERVIRMVIEGRIERLIGIVIEALVISKQRECIYK